MAKDIAQDESTSSMILDLEGADFISSAFIGSLIGMYKRLKERNGYFVLCNITRNVLGVLEISGLTKYFIICDSLESAREKIGSL